MNTSSFPPPTQPGAALPPPLVPPVAPLAPPVGEPSNVAPPQSGPTRHTERTLVAWLLGGALLFGAWLIVGATPSHRDLVAPFEVTTPIGDWGTGRNLSARVTGARWASSIDDGRPHEGNWLVLDVEAAAVIDDQHASLLRADLTIDGSTYTPTDRTLSLITAHPLTTGIPLSGSLAYEIPENRMNGVAELHLALDPDPQLDSVIVVQLDLNDLDHTDSARLDPATWSTQ